ncbi:hypothetical protein ACFWBX_11525 [Streptomyces sp. NPDC059991]|uniref:hypothetical protein n=1 Tax=Streptomyces sp. NPDC059991 TaxID=3347028 RepID=UPI00369242A4
MLIDDVEEEAESCFPVEDPHVGGGRGSGAAGVPRGTVALGYFLAIALQVGLAGVALAMLLGPVRELCRLYRSSHAQPRR